MRKRVYRVVGGELLLSALVLFTAGCCNQAAGAERALPKLSTTGTGKTMQPSVKPGETSDWFTSFGNKPPTAGDDVRVNGRLVVSKSFPYARCGNLVVSRGGELVVKNRGSVRVHGVITTEGDGRIILLNGGSLAAPRNTFWLWIIIGFAGQAAFTGRMLVQWIASEKARKSVVPRVFWVMSLIGSAMLLSYAIYRKDIVIISGQAFGSFVYVRNLVLGKKK